MRRERRRWNVDSNERSGSFQQGYQGGYYEKVELLMQVEFFSSFSKDLDKIKSKKLKKSIISVIEKIEQANSLNEVANV